MTLARLMPAIYFVVGQVGWFACVLGAARGAPWFGVWVVLVLVALHLARATRPWQEIKLLAAVLIIGGVWDSALVRAGMLAYAPATPIDGGAPVWILALWVLFAAQFNTTYGWLKSRIWAAALLGALAGPLSFRAGAALGALRFAKPWPAALALSLGWAVILPLLVLVSRRWNGIDAPART